MKYLDDLMAEAIAFIRNTAKQFGPKLYSGNSGGKDSAVLEYLLQESGINYISEYNNTSIDPPGTISYIKKNFPYTSINHPEMSFYKILETKGFPTRWKRFCCTILKEGKAGRITYVGVRAAESNFRATLDRISYDTRPGRTGTINLLPLLHWTEDDIFAFVHYKGIELNKLYDRFSRLGCIGCPLAATEVREEEFEEYPGIKKQIIKSMKIGMDSHPNWKISVATDHDPYKAFDWWMSGTAISTFFHQYEFAKTKDGWAKALRPPKKPNPIHFVGWNYAPNPSNGWTTYKNSFFPDEC